jgi:molybdopterin adenylyltransferase
MKTHATRIGIVIALDIAHNGTCYDVSRPAIDAYPGEVLSSDWQGDYRLIPDEIEAIAETLIDLVDKARRDLGLIAGGTGPALRDMTPEAMARVVGRLLPGFGEEMRRASLREVPTAILSRQEARLWGRCLIVSLPGKPSNIAACLDAVFPAIPYCLDLIVAARLEMLPERLMAFREPLNRSAENVAIP